MSRSRVNAACGARTFGARVSCASRVSRISRASRASLAPLVVAGFALTLVSCAPAITPAPPPAPLPELPPVEALPVRPVRIAITARHDTARYDMVSDTRLTRDSAGQPLEESVTLSARIALATQRLPRRDRADSRDSVGSGRSAAELRSTGRVDGFIIQSTSRVAGARAAALPGVATAAATPSLPLTVAFDATLDGLSSRVVPRPTLANECDRPEISALGMVRELLVRLPDSVSVGDAWADTARVFVCRGGVPVVTQTVAQVTVRALEDGPNGVATRVMLDRALVSRVEGELVTAWRRVSVTGAGAGTQQLVVDAVTGMVEQLNGESTLTVTLRDSARPDDGQQVVTQRVTLTATRRPQ